jgi:hypothetical protein
MRVVVFSSGSQVSQGLRCACLKKGTYVLQFFLLCLTIACEKPATVFSFSILAEKRKPGLSRA